MSAYIPKNSSPLRYSSFPPFTDNQADHVDPTVQQKNQARKSPSEHELLSSLPECHTLSSSNTPTTATSQQPCLPISENQNRPPRLRRTVRQTVRKMLPEELDALLTKARKTFINSDEGLPVISTKKKDDWDSIEKRFFTEINYQLEKINEEMRKESKNYKKIEYIKEKIDRSIKFFLNTDPSCMREASQSIENWNEFSSTLKSIFNEENYKIGQEDIINLCQG